MQSARQPVTPASSSSSSSSSAEGTR
jgi:hypothetical protein